LNNLDPAGGYCLGSRVRLLRRLVGAVGGSSSLVTAAMAGGLAKLPWSAWYLITSSMSWLCLCRDCAQVANEETQHREGAID
jgi:hypothetical protein